ncbi:MAG: class I SAM-dependent methyltransferase, partial [Acidobacteria bacterium]|nr:class I SAM-dependent methyltransferase [Acidobacteriota bacterium]
MRPEIIDFLICPINKKPLQYYILSSSILDKNDNLDINLGFLFQQDFNGIVYPIVKSIPRMLPDSIKVFFNSFKEYWDKLPLKLKELILKNIRIDYKLGKDFIHTQKSFSSEWTMLKYEDTAWGRDKSERYQEILSRLDINENDLFNKAFLDVGCGHGEIELALGHLPINIFAVDLSYSVDMILESIPKDTLAHYHIIQANAHYLPFKDEIFDFVYSDGVLHHTSDTKKGVKEITRLVRENGKLFIMVYSKDHKTILDLIIHNFIQVIRKITLIIPHNILKIICYMLSPFHWVHLRILVLLFKRKRNLKRTLRELSLSLFDGLSPKYDWNHSTKEVRDWFDKNPSKANSLNDKLQSFKDINENDLFNKAFLDVGCGH